MKSVKKQAPKSDKPKGRITKRESIGASVTRPDLAIPDIAGHQAVNPVQSRVMSRGRVMLQPLGGPDLYGDVTQNPPPNTAKMPQTKPGRKTSVSSNGSGDTPKSLNKIKTKLKGSLPTKPVLPEIDKYENILLGNLENLPAERSNMIRIFLSSTFSDFKAERNALVREAYPVLQEYCKEKGFDFQVQDLRWGITDEATNDHSVEKLCLQEIEHCQRLSQGPNFVIMLGDRYGFRPICTEIDAEEFEQLLAIIKEKEMPEQDLLPKWYKKDENAVPPQYFLQTVRTHLPHFADPNPEAESKRKEHAAIWAKEQKAMHILLKESAKEALQRKIMTKNIALKYVVSVTELELHKGFNGKTEPSSSCLCILRNFENVKINPDDKMAKKYFDLDVNGKLDTETATMMKKLKSEKIPSGLPKNNICTYGTEWKDGGVNPLEHSSHKAYVDSMCDGFVTEIKNLIDAYQEVTKAERTKERQYTVTFQKPNADDVPVTTSKEKSKQAKTSDMAGKSGSMVPFAHTHPGTSTDMFMGVMQMRNIISDHEAMANAEFDGTMVYASEDRPKLNAEILHHLHFCKRKCDSFCGRNGELEKVRSYLKNTESSKPLIIWAPSGAGKTAFAAMIAKSTKALSKDKGVTIIRFLGTSPESSTLLKVLGSVCEHIYAAYGQPVHKRELKNLNRVTAYFMNTLNYISVKYGPRRPLYIILDSIDQLSRSDGSQCLKWLPRTCPPFVKLVLTFIPDIGDLLVNAQKLLKSKNCFIALSPLTPVEAKEMCVLALKKRNRMLATPQTAILNEAIERDSNPLLVQLWLDAAMLWPSYAKMSSSSLAQTSTVAIYNIFNRLEAKFGESFIRTTMGYITLCKDGISQVELEDTLSCNDEILNDVYRYHDPPVKGVVRIPPLLWARVLNDLGDYIVERKTHSRTVLGWYHRQFLEAALDRYGSGEAACKIHAQLADLFLAEDSLRKTITLSHRKLTITDADRGVSFQPLLPSNTRKLKAIFYHITASQDVDRLKRILEEIKYLQCLAEALSSSKHLQNALEALKYMEDSTDTEIAIVVKAIHLTCPVFSQYPELFPTQMLAQLLASEKDSKFILRMCSCFHDFLENSRTPQMIALSSPSNKSGAALKWHFPGPTQLLGQTPDGHYIAVNAKSPGILCQLVDTYKGMVTITLARHNTLGKDVAVTAFISEKSERVFALTRNFVLIWNKDEVQCESNNVNKKGNLNSRLLVSSDDSYMILAGPSRLAMFEENNGKYTVKRVMDLNGCIATTNIIFSDDVAMTLSTHSIKGKSKEPFGAIVVWDFWNEKLRVRVPVSGPVVAGSLYKLPHYGQPNTVLCTCTDGRIFIVNLGEGKVLSTLMGTRLQGSIVTCFDSQSNMLAVASSEANVTEVWDVLNGTKLNSISTEEVTGVTFTSNGKLLGLSHNSGFVTLYETLSGKLVSNQECHTGAIRYLLAQDEDNLITMGEDSLVQLWSVEHIMDKKDKHAQENLQYTALYSADVKSYTVLSSAGKLITGADGRVEAWTLSDGNKEKVLHEEPGVFNLCRTDDKIFAINANSGSLLTWDENLERVELNLKPNIIQMFQANLSNDIIIQSSQDGKMCIEIMDAVKLNVKGTVWLNEGTSPHDIKLTKDNKSMIFVWKKEDDEGEEDCDVTSYKLKSKEVTDGTEREPPSDMKVYSLEVIVNDVLLLGSFGKAFVWNVGQTLEKTVKKVAEANWLIHKIKTKKKGVTKEVGEEAPLTFVAASPDGKKLITGSVLGCLRLWNNVLLGSKDVSAVSLEGHTGMVACGLIFSSHSKLHLVTGSRDNTLRLWDLNSGTQLTMTSLPGPVIMVSGTYGSDNKIIVKTVSMKTSRLSIWKLSSLVE